MNLLGDPVNSIPRPRRVVSSQTQQNCSASVRTSISTHLQMATVRLIQHRFLETASAIGRPGAPHTILECTIERPERSESALRAYVQDIPSCWLGQQSAGICNAVTVEQLVEIVFTHLLADQFADGCCTRCSTASSIQPILLPEWHPRGGTTCAWKQ